MARSEQELAQGASAALTATGVAPKQAEDLLWLTFSIVRGLAVRTLWQDEPRRFERLFALWRRIAWQATKGKPDRKAARAKARRNGG